MQGRSAPTLLRIQPLLLLQQGDLLDAICCKLKFVPMALLGCLMQLPA